MCCGRCGRGLRGQGGVMLTFPARPYISPSGLTDTSMTAVLDQLATLADTTRSRLLLVLERHELTVSELCAVLQLPQSTVSRHLRILGDDGWVASRAEGTSRQYRLASPLPESAARLWSVVREQMSGGVQVEHDAGRL